MKNQVLNSIGKFMSKNGRIMAGAGAVVGVVVTAVLAYQARPKADKIIEEKKKKREEIDANEEITEEEKTAAKKEVTKETVKELVPVFAPTVVCGAAAAGLAAGSVISGERTIRRLMDLATVSDVAYKELYDKTREVIGQEKTDEIIKDINQAKVDQMVIDDAVIYDCGGPYLFFDALSGRLFRASETAVHDAVLRCNQRLTRGQECYITLNEFYQEIGLPAIPLGEDRAWGGFTAADMLEEHLGNAIRWGEGSATVLDWYVRPMLGFNRG